MQKRRFLLCVPLVLACLTSAAQAVTRTDYDAAAKRWITYDTKATGFFYGGGASSIPRELVNYDGPYGPNTIVISTDERRLYYIFEKGKAIKYGIGVGREGFQWSGTDTISMKAEWPGWTPPPEMITREKAKGRILPNYMAGGVDNPLGARALYIGGRIYRIHGSNEPWSIGHAVSSGCIRLTNQDIIDLYDRVSVGTRVVVLLSTQPQTEDAVASTGGEDKPFVPRQGLKASSPGPSPAAPVVAVKASAKVIDKAVDKPVVLAKVPAQPAAETAPVAAASPPPAPASPPVVEAKAAVEPAPEAKPATPAIEVKAAVSAAMSGSPVAVAQARAAIEVKKPVVVVVPDRPSRKDEPVDSAPVAPAPAAAAPAEDVSGQGRS
jgi:lipoprotein-anchoring transpeptidase ErfK/SrfK